MFLLQIVHFIAIVLLLVLFARLVVDLTGMIVRKWEPTGLVEKVFTGIRAVTDPPLKVVGFLFRPFFIYGTKVDVAFVVLFLILMVIINLTNT